MTMKLDLISLQSPHSLESFSPLCGGFCTHKHLSAAGEWTLVDNRCINFNRLQLPFTVGQSPFELSILILG